MNTSTHLSGDGSERYLFFNGYQTNNPTNVQLPDDTNIRITVTDVVGCKAAILLGRFLRLAEYSDVMVPDVALVASLSL